MVPVLRGHKIHEVMEPETSAVSLVITDEGGVSRRVSLFRHEFLVGLAGRLARTRSHRFRRPRFNQCHGENGKQEAAKSALRRLVPLKASDKEDFYKEIGLKEEAEKEALFTSSGSLRDERGDNALFVGATTVEPSAPEKSIDWDQLETAIRVTATGNAGADAVTILRPPTSSSSFLFFCSPSSFSPPLSHQKTESYSSEVDSNQPPTSGRSSSANAVDKTGVKTEFNEPEKDIAVQRPANHSVCNKDRVVYRADCGRPPLTPAAAQIKKSLTSPIPETPGDQVGSGQRSDCKFAKLKKMNSLTVFNDNHLSADKDNLQNGRRFIGDDSVGPNPTSNGDAMVGRKRSQSLMQTLDDEAASVLTQLLPSNAYKIRRFSNSPAKLAVCKQPHSSSLMNVNETQSNAASTYYAAPGVPIALAISSGGSSVTRRRRSSAFITHNLFPNPGTLSAGGTCPCARALANASNGTNTTPIPCTKRCCVARVSIGSYYGSTDLLNLEDGYRLNDWECGAETPPQDAPEFWTFGEEYENVTLMYAKHEKIPMKDFGSEIRATMDIDHLLNKAVVLLDLPETSLEEIFNKIIHEMDIQEPEFTSEQVKNALFTQDAGNQFHILSRTVQSICTTNLAGGTFDYDQTWICALCMLPTVSHRHVAIGRLSHPTNLGRTMQDLRFIIIVIAPSRAKGTKTALETARTFATLFADLDIRQRLVMAQGVESFRLTMLQAAKELAVEQNQWRERKFSLHLSDAKEQLVGPTRWYLGRGILEDVRKRAPYYLSDYLDGIRGPKTMQKLLSTVVFLYFACLLPSIALGVLNDDNTNGQLGVKKAIYAQAIGGLFFAIFGGQPMIILLTTVPLAIYVKIIFRISQDYNLDFFTMYACVGLWAQFFLILYANTELSNIMRFATRSTEEIFSLFISLAFIVEAFKALNLSFGTCYKGGAGDIANCTKCNSRNASGLINSSAVISSSLLKNASTMLNSLGRHDDCHRENSILYILLMAGTLWLGLFLYNFRKTPFLTRAKREILADYAMPVAVIAMSCTGAIFFKDIKVERFEYNATAPVGVIAQIWTLNPIAIFASMGLGFCLSLLFFIDQNLTSAIVNNQQNKLRKGSATHLDLFVVAMLNIFLSLLGLPWMHAALPHSPLHLRALADVEERASQGHVLEVITNVRETRLAAIIANGLILLSALFLLPVPLNFIPRSVLDGLFLYMALTSVNGNEMFERVLLLLTEQAAYPPTHYIRRVPQRKIHLFTCCQIIQLILLCTVGFFPWPYVEMVFPIVVFFFLPIRHVLIPKMIDYKYLDALDGRH